MHVAADFPEAGGIGTSSLTIDLVRSLRYSSEGVTTVLLVIVDLSLGVVKVVCGQKEGLPVI